MRGPPGWSAVSWPHQPATHHHIAKLWSWAGLGWAGLAVSRGGLQPGTGPLRGDQPPGVSAAWCGAAMVGMAAPVHCSPPRDQHPLASASLCVSVSSRLCPPPGGDLVKIAGWAAYTPHPSHPGPGAVVHPGSVHTMKFHDAGVSPVGGGVMAGYHHHNLMDMYPGPAINTMDWKNTSQVRASCCCCG